MLNTYILQSLVGSRAHRLDTPESDYDYKSVFFAPRALFFDPWRTAPQTLGRDDDVSYEFQHFVRLACTGNPTVLEVLFSAAEGNTVLPTGNNGSITYDPQLGQELIDMRWKLLDSRRIFEAHRGFARSQLKKLEAQNVTPRRKRKALTTYIRVMGMAIDFFQGEGYNVAVPAGRRARLLEVRGMSDEQTAEFRHARVFTELERKLEAAYELREHTYEVSQDAKRLVLKLADAGYA